MAVAKSGVMGGKLFAKPEKPQEAKRDQAKEDGANLVNKLLIIDSSEIMPFAEKDRTMAELQDDPTFEEMVNDFRAGKMNVQPVKIRPYKPKPNEKPAKGIKYEEVFGFKRLMAAKEAKAQVLCIWQDMTDKEAKAEMILENKNRSSIKPWAKLLSWSNILQKQEYTLEELAELEGKKADSIENYLTILDVMDPRIVDALPMHQFGFEALYEIRSTLRALEGDPKAVDKFVNLLIEHEDDVKAGKANQKFILKLRSQVVPQGAKPKQFEPTVLKAKTGRDKFATFKPTKTGYSVTFHASGSKAIGMSELEEIVKEVLKKRGIDL